MTAPICIPLNSFVRRTAKTDGLKQLIKSTGAVLARKGRSRNWSLQANNQQLILLIQDIEASGEEGWYWVAKKISEHQPKLTQNELLEYARARSGITLTQLMAATDCKMQEARKVIDDLEWE